MGYRVNAVYKEGGLITRSGSKKAGLGDVAAALGMSFKNLTKANSDDVLHVTNAMLTPEDLMKLGSGKHPDAGKLEELHAKLEALEKANKELQLKAANAGSGELGEELEAAARAGFVEKLTEVLAMRRGGKFDENIADGS